MFVVSSGHGGVVASNLLYFDGMYYKLHVCHMQVTCRSHGSHMQVTWMYLCHVPTMLTLVTPVLVGSHACLDQCVWSLLPQSEAEDCMQGSQ